MTIAEIEKTIAEMEAEIAELKEKLEEAKNINDINPDVFIPKYDEDYWLIYSDGEKSFKQWEDTSQDKDRLTLGNVFRTKEEAEFEVERLKVIHELKMYAEPRDMKWDGKNDYYLITYSLGTDTIDIYCHRWFKYDAIYFSSRERALEAIKSVGEERIKKYYLCVEDGNI